MKKLKIIQSELKAPKSNFNNFGKYNYRSCEDILEAVKPLLLKNDCILTITDTIEAVGNRVYVRATAIITDCENENTVGVSAFAREPEQKKGMDESQITGAASSYARKYALNGLFCIDDNQDADSTNKHDNDNLSNNRKELNTSKIMPVIDNVNPLVTQVKTMAACRSLPENMKLYFDKLDYQDARYTKEIFNRNVRDLEKYAEVF